MDLNLNQRIFNLTTELNQLTEKTDKNVRALNELTLDEVKIREVNQNLNRLKSDFNAQLKIKRDQLLKLIADFNIKIDKIKLDSQGIEDSDDLLSGSNAFGQLTGKDIINKTYLDDLYSKFYDITEETYTNYNELIITKLKYFIKKIFLATAVLSNKFLKEKHTVDYFNYELTKKYTLFLDILKTNKAYISGSVINMITNFMPDVYDTYFKKVCFFENFI